MINPTREKVTKAPEWQHLRYIVSPESLADLDMYHDPDEVDDNIATLQALCRIQHEALKNVVEGNDSDYGPELVGWRGSQYEIEAKATLALLPTEGKTNGTN